LLFDIPAKVGNGQRMDARCQKFWVCFIHRDTLAYIQWEVKLFRQNVA
jgi:hypothetical protein